MKLNIHKYIVEFIAENIIFFGFTIPSILVSLSLIQNNHILKFSISIGSCKLLQIPIEINFQTFLIIMAGITNIITSIIMAFVGYQYKNNPKKRLEFYSKWQKNTKYSLIILIFLFLNINCFENSTFSDFLNHFFNFDNYQAKVTMFVLIGLYILAILLKKEANKEMEDTSNKSS